MINFSKNRTQASGSIGKKSIIEFAGLPNSGKTTISKALKRSLRQKGVKCIYHPSASSFSHLRPRELGWKYDLWAVSKIFCQLVEFELDDFNTVAIFDRGVYDSLCWLEWFRKKSSHPSPEIKVLQELVRSQRFSGFSYHLHCCAVSHKEAGKRGKDESGIINRNNFGEFEAIYGDIVSLIGQASPNIHVHRHDTNSVTPSNLVEVVESSLAL